MTNFSWKINLRPSWHLTALTAAPFGLFAALLLEITLAFSNSLANFHIFVTVILILSFSYCLLMFSVLLTLVHFLTNHNERMNEYFIDPKGRLHLQIIYLMPGIHSFFFPHKKI